jgi:lysophospholipase L1-like esterase
MARKSLGVIRGVLVRAALVGFGLVVGLVLLEVCLQTAAAVREAVAPRAVARWTGNGTRRVLCLGDSNTYGLLVGSDDPYPKVLERLWNAAHPDSPIEVLNLGFPGTNSSMVRNAFPKLVETLRPDLVTIMVGVNDFWTVPEPVQDGPLGAGWLGTRLWKASRVYRLCYLLRRQTGPPPRVEVQDTFSPDRHEGDRRTVRAGGVELTMAWRPMALGTPFLWDRPLRVNLEAIAANAGRLGVPVVFVTYPALRHAYPIASKAIRKAAAESGTFLVDLGLAFKKVCRPRLPCDEFFPDGHPNRAGHQRAGRLLLEALERAEVPPRFPGDRVQGGDL